MKKYKILKTRICYLDYERLVNKIITASENNQNLTIAPIASHPIVNSMNNKILQTSLNNFDLVLPDGQSLIWAANFLYGSYIRERIYGPDLLLKLCIRCEKEKIRVILYGNNTNLVSQKLKQIYSKIMITALPDLNYKKIDNTDVHFLLKTLNKYNKSITFIGIGSPAQHFLLNELKKVKMPVLAVGAAFDFVADVQKQAPKWIRQLGFEWLYRLINEPQRLWKRYLIYAPLFVLLVFFQKKGLLFEHE